MCTILSLELHELRNEFRCSNVHETGFFPILLNLGPLGPMIWGKHEIYQTRKMKFDHTHYVF